MTTRSVHVLLAGAFALTASLPTIAVAQTPLGTAFTYQGRLDDGGSPATGTYDVQLVLFDAASAGSQVGPTVTREDVVVANGLFTIPVDFGAVFGGSKRWLQVGVRPGSSTGAFVLLAPRQELTPSPNAAFSAAAPWTGVTGKPAGFADDADDDVLGGLSCANGEIAKRSGSAWTCAVDAIGAGTVTAVTGGTGLSGGTITASGTLAVDFGGGGAATTVSRSDHVHFGQTWVGSGTGLRVESTTGDALVGSQTGSASGVRGSGNSPAGYGGYFENNGGGPALGVSAGGIRFSDGTTQTTAASGSGTPGWSLTGNAGTSPATNFVGTTDYQAFELRVDNRRALRIEPQGGVGGMFQAPNVLLGYEGNSVVPGVNGAVVNGGGTYGVPTPNRVTGSFGTVAGGFNNVAGDADGNTDTGTFASIGGGYNNVASGGVATIGGGQANGAVGTAATVGGGYLNQSTAFFATIGGGGQNVASGSSSTVPGGNLNLAGGQSSFAAGYRAKVRDAAQSGDANGDEGTFAWADSVNDDFTSTGPNQFLVRATGGVGINTNAPGYHLEVASPTDTQVAIRSTASNHVWSLQATAAVGTSIEGAFQIIDRTAGANRLTIDTNGRLGLNTGFLILPFQLTVNGEAGKPGGGSWSNFSDARLKHDIEPLSGTLEKLLSLRGVSFEYDDPASIHELAGRRIGMIAQEVAPVFPDWVAESPNGYLNLTYRGFEALTVEALRDLRAEKDAEIAALRSEMEALKAAVAALTARTDRDR
jgi:hypothetical protein